MEVLYPMMVTVPVGSASEALDEQLERVSEKLRCGRFGGPIGMMTGTLVLVDPGRE